MKTAVGLPTTVYATRNKGASTQTDEAPFILEVIDRVDKVAIYE